MKGTSGITKYSPPETIRENSYVNGSSIDGRLVAARYSTTTQNALYSSITGLVKDYIASQFPPNFFKTLYIRNSIHAVTEQGVSDDDKAVKDLPALSLLLNYQPQDASFNGDSFLEGKVFVRREQHSRGGSSASKIIADWNEHIFVTAPITRIKNVFEVTFTVDSEMQGINLQGYLRSNFGVNRPYYLNRRMIEVPIPYSIMGAIAKVRGFDLNDKDDFNKFLDYIRHVSKGGVINKLHPTSNQHLFFFRYFTNILFKVSDLDNVDGQRDNKALLEANVKMNVEVEYNHHEYFIAETYHNLETPEASPYISDNVLGAQIHWSIPLTLTQELENGMTCILHLSMVTDINSAIDVTPLDNALSPELQYYIKSLTPEEREEKLLVALLQNGKEVESEGFDVDWDKLEVSIHRPLMNSDYKLVIYGYMAEINEVVKSYKKEDKNNPLDASKKKDLK